MRGLLPWRGGGKAVVGGLPLAGERDAPLTSARGLSWWGLFAAGAAGAAAADADADAGADATAAADAAVPVPSLDALTDRLAADGVVFAAPDAARRLDDPASAGSHSPASVASAASGASLRRPPSSAGSASSVAPAPLPAARVDRLALIGRFRAAVPVRSRVYHGRLYRGVSVGNEAVAAVVAARLAPTGRSAVALGAALLAAGVFAHVADEHGFKDAYFFYRYNEYREEEDLPCWFGESAETAIVDAR